MHETKLIEDLSRELISNENIESIVEDKLDDFTKNQSVEVFYVDPTGRVILPLNSNYYNLGSILKDYSAISIGSVHTTNRYRLTRLSDDRYLFFKFTFPPPPEKWIYELETSDFNKPEYFLFFAAFFLFNTVCLISYSISNYFIMKRMNYHTEIAVSALNNIDDKTDFSLLKPQGYHDYDYLIDSFNTMISKIHTDVALLKKKDEELKQLIQETSHDFKTPLTSISSITQNLIDYSESLDKATVKKNLGYTLAEVNFMSKMVEELLFISSISIDNTNEEDVDLEDLVQYELDILSTGIELTLELTRGITFLANKIHITRMVKNLIRNAITYSDSEVKVVLKEDLNAISLIIENDGGGIKDKESYGVRKKTRVLDTTNGLHISMGLGSVIIRKLVERYQGSLEIIDRDGGGTVISITLPKNTKSLLL